MIQCSQPNCSEQGQGIAPYGFLCKGHAESIAIQPILERKRQLTLELSRLEQQILQITDLYKPSPKPLSHSYLCACNREFKDFLALHYHILEENSSKEHFERAERFGNKLQLKDDTKVGTPRARDASGNVIPAIKVPKKSPSIVSDMSDL